MTTITAERLEAARRYAESDGKQWHPKTVIALLDHIDELAARNAELDRDYQLQFMRADKAEAELARRDAQEPVTWGAPKSVAQLISQLRTLDPNLEITAVLRMPKDFRDGNAIRAAPLSISYEKFDGQWLSAYKGDGRKVLVFWAKPDDRSESDKGELLTAAPAPVVPPEWKLSDATAFIDKHCPPSEEEAALFAWNACRAVMLKGGVE